MANSRAVQTGQLVAAFTFFTFASAVTAVRAQEPPPSQQPAADTGHHESAGAMIGRVIDSLGTGVPGAEITIVKSAAIHAVSGDSGQFRLTGLPTGTVVFAVRRIGFEAATFTAVLHPGKIARGNFRLTASPQALPAVAVKDSATQTHWLDNFDRRRNEARGIFFSRADIEREGARTGTDIVRSVAGIRLVNLRGGFGRQVLMTRGNGTRACVPQMFVHNMPYSGSLDDFIADDIEALEVYVGISEIPPELSKNGRGGDCGAIVVWTRDPSKKP